MKAVLRVRCVAKTREEERVRGSGIVYGSDSEDCKNQ